MLLFMESVLSLTLWFCSGKLLWFLRIAGKQKAKKENGKKIKPDDANDEREEEESKEAVAFYKVGYLRPVSTRDNRVLKGPLDRSLRSFARTAHSAHSLRSAPLQYACSVHGLAHLLRSLPRGTVEILEYVFTL